jgi:F-type H+-transporting ATPase subunit gamma
MAKTREIRKRIGSVRTIRKITHTMERVAQSKSMKLTGRFDSARGFRADLLRLLPEALGAAPGTLLATQEIVRHPLGVVRSPVKRVLLFCVTSSRGLCGGYNSHVIQAAEARIAALADEGREPVLAVIGRKGLAYFRYHKRDVALPVPDADEHVPFSRIGGVAQEIIDLYTRKEIDEVEVVSTHLRTRVQQEVRRVPLLPYVPETAAGSGAPVQAPEAAGPAQGPDGSPLYIVEPGRPDVLAVLLPLLVQTRVFCLVLEAMLCEQSQRTLAMRSASDNADAMTKKLTRTYNRARQAQITNEMIEIISGSEGGRS